MWCPSASMHSMLADSTRHPQTLSPTGCLFLRAAPREITGKKYALLFNDLPVYKEAVPYVKYYFMQKCPAIHSVKRDV